MILKKFIKKLENIKNKYGADIEVVMADNLTVINPIFMENYPDNGKVVITDGR